MQVYVLLNEGVRLHYVQAMGLTVSLSEVCVFVCVCLHSEWIKGFPVVSLQPPVRSSTELGSHRRLIPYLQDKNRAKGSESLVQRMSPFLEVTLDARNVLCEYLKCLEG